MVTEGELRRLQLLPVGDVSRLMLPTQHKCAYPAENTCPADNIGLVNLYWVVSLLDIPEK